MTAFATAPVLAALLIFVLVATLRAPVFQDARRRIVQAPSKDKTPLAFARERTTGRVDLNLLSPAEFSHYSSVASAESHGFSKRAFDVVAAWSLLIVCAPLLILTAIVIKVDSPGPVLYRQRRIGADGKPFKIYKFRSMVVNAEKNGAQWADKDDCRVTRVGRFIRKTRIDEIPQAINILRGEMSFVGPRPERPEFVEVLEKEIPNYHLRHVVRPGITGWAQVKYVYGASVEDARIKLQYDLYYIKHISLWRDILIVLMTVRVALFGLGSR